MSTLNVNTINAATSGQAVAVDVQNPRSFRNLIVNGSCIVAQRSTAAVNNGSATSNLIYETIDRWGYWANAASVFSIQQVADSPADFQKSLKVTSLGARSIVTGDYFMVAQGLEGQNIQHLNWGTANAKDCILSFHVKSSLTGTFTGYLHGTDNFKPTYVFTYTISSADTWEKKTITITAPGATYSGDFGDAGSNAKGLEVGFNLGVGTTYATSNVNQWVDGTPGRFMIGTTSSVDVVATNAATWQVTGVQLEVGDVATDFEHRSFGDELARCQRYYQKSYDYETAVGTATNTGCVMHSLSVSQNYASPGSVRFPVQMRDGPTVTTYSTQNADANGKITADSTDANGVAWSQNETGTSFVRSNDSSGTAVNVFIKCHYTAEAEL